ncbi:DNA/RNA non-specific endonuclease [Undibacterium sp. Di26W]|uniref:DNA/RNA non-specific endonuclease n=1 Tax=Undibacterium sp. Di26W TaxID=3413035 RepID=UPI003BF3E33B
MMSVPAPLQQAKAELQQSTQSAPQTGVELATDFVDARPQAVAQRQRQEMANNSAQAKQLRAYQHMMQNSPRSLQLKSVQAIAAQRLENEDPVQNKLTTVQKSEEDNDPLQAKLPDDGTAQLVEQPSPKPDNTANNTTNNTDLPNQLKAGIESLSGMSMDHVKVNFDSDKPAQLNAHAYAQGSDIHVAPGQEQHLPHEAWHVVQQAQGRVRPTMQMKEGTPVNDDKGLEAEADVMGAKALATGENVAQAANINNTQSALTPSPANDSSNAIQMASSETINKISYETEDFPYKKEKKARERVSKVVIMGRNKSDNVDPETARSFVNLDKNEYEDMEGYHKGHVAARQFGGTYRNINMVPMLPKFNFGEWKNIENTIKPYIGKNKVTIEPKYEDEDSRVPNRIAVNIDSVTSFSVLHDVVEREQFVKEDMEFISDESKVKKNKNHALQCLADAHKKGQIPDNYKNSPYLALDILWLNSIKGHGDPKTWNSYQSWQIDWIIKYNRGLNGGEMESDAWTFGTNEPYQKLREAGRQDKPEVDHIVPNLSGGANLFTNARLVSWKLNNSIERNVSPSQKFTKW